MDSDAAQAFFVAGTLPLIVFGALHVIGTLLDTTRPTFFTPLDDSLRTELQRTGIRLRRMAGGTGAKPSMWRIWLGINVSHGLGVATFGLVCLLVAAHDYALVDRIAGLRELTIAFPVVFVAVSLRFWFWGPLLITTSSATCFILAAVL